MKNLTRSVAFAVVTFFSISKQANAQADKVSVGIKAGLSYASLSPAKLGGSNYKYDYIPGLQIGLFLDAPIAKSIFFSPQVLFTQKGGSMDLQITDARTRLNYIDVPLLVGFKADSRLTFYIGPQVSFLTSQKLSVVSHVVTQTSTDKSRSNSSVVGGNVGAGYQFAKGVGVNLHYMFDLQKAEKSQYTTGERNVGFTLTLGIKFQ